MHAQQNIKLKGLQKEQDIKDIESHASLLDNNNIQERLENVSP